jgi:hypothetical protein
LSNCVGDAFKVERLALDEDAEAEDDVEGAGLGPPLGGVGQLVGAGDRGRRDDVGLGHAGLDQLGAGLVGQRGDQVLVPGGANETHPQPCDGLGRVGQRHAQRLLLARVEGADYSAAVMELGRHGCV